MFTFSLWYVHLEDKRKMWSRSVFATVKKNPFLKQSFCQKGEARSGTPLSALKATERCYVVSSTSWWFKIDTKTTTKKKINNAILKFYSKTQQQPKERIAGGKLDYIKNLQSGYSSKRWLIHQINRSAMVHANRPSIILPKSGRSMCSAEWLWHWPLKRKHLRAAVTYADFIPSLISKYTCMRFSSFLWTKSMHNLQDILAPVLGVNTTLSVFIGPDFVNVLKML